MTEDTAKTNVKEMLERIWKSYSGRFDGQGHDLIVLAVPHYPANIEAIASLDLGVVAELLMAFTKERKLDELHSVQHGAGASPDETQGQAAGDTETARSAVEVGEGDNGAGTPTQRPDAPPETDEGDAATYSVELKRRSTEDAIAFVNSSSIPDDWKVRIIESIEYVDAQLFFNQASAEAAFQSKAGPNVTMVRIEMIRPEVREMVAVYACSRYPNMEHYAYIRYGRDFRTAAAMATELGRDACDTCQEK